MEKESFEDKEVADILNKHYVAIKVDREERPDIDHIYMSACQAFTGRGGWPLTVFLMPDAKPFYAGTYFPKQNRMGIRGLISILQRINVAWDNNRASIIESGEEIINVISGISNESYLEPPGLLKHQNSSTSIGTQESLKTPGSRTLDIEDNSHYNYITDQIIHNAFSLYKDSFDNIYGGFGRAPKFPTPHNLMFLLRYWYITEDLTALDIVEKTLDSMYVGGIYDHVGFGFSRYSTDRKWLVPHFEKMLYDNALLAIVYLEAYQATHNNKYGFIAGEIFSYILRDMTSPEGGFYSAEDADSEGEEGKFYTWSIAEIKEALGEKNWEDFCSYYGVTAEGNFGGKTILNLIGQNKYPNFLVTEIFNNNYIKKCRKGLFKFREERIRPHKDDKILTSWNGLMIAAMAMGGRILKEESYTYASKRAVDFIFTRLTQEDGRLLARYRDGDASFQAYIDDYAFLIWGLIELYETTYEPAYLKRALHLNNELIKYFWDEKEGGLFFYGSDSEKLIIRPKEIYDGAIPSGNSVSALNFLRLAKITSQYGLEDRAHNIFRVFSNDIQNHPMGYAFSLVAILFSQTAAKEVIIAANSKNDITEELLNALHGRFMPFTHSIIYTNDHKDLNHVSPFISGYKPINGKPTFYICENFSCREPITDINLLNQLLG